MVSIYIRVMETILATPQMLNTQTSYLERQISDFSWRLINNNLWEQDFWQQSKNLRLFWEQMLSTVMMVQAYPSRKDTPQTNTEVMDRLTNILRRLAEVHAAAVDSLILIEVNSDPQPTRSENCLRWNGGARIQRCVTLRTSLPEASQKVFVTAPRAVFSRRHAR